MELENWKKIKNVKNTFCELDIAIHRHFLELSFGNIHFNCQRYRPGERRKPVTFPPFAVLRNMLDAIWLIGKEPSKIYYLDPGYLMKRKPTRCEHRIWTYNFLSTRSETFRQRLMGRTRKCERTYEEHPRDCLKK